MSTTEELAQSHNGIGINSPMIADNLSTRHEPVVKSSLMNSQEDGPRPVENEISSAESSRTQDQDAKNEAPKPEEKSTDAKKDEESSSEKQEEPIQKVTFSLLTTPSAPKSDEKPSENSAAHEPQVEQPMDVDQQKEKPQKASSDAQEAVGSAAAEAEKSEEKDKKETKTEEGEKAEEEKSAEEKEADSEDKPKDESGAAAEPEEKSRKRAAGRKPGSSRSAKKTKTSESGGDEEASTTPKKEPPKRGQRKAEKPKEGEETEGEEAESASKEEKTPLLEAPLIVEGKRSRQRTERLDSNVLVTPLQKEFEIPEGRGVKLGDIEFIDATISRTPTTDLKILHKLIYGRVGTTPAEIKKNLRLFCGFEFTENSKDYEKKKKSLDHLVMKDTKTVCKMVGLETSGRKDELIDALLHFLIEPKDKGKKLPQTPATKRKRGSTPSSSRKRSAGKRASSSRKAKKSGDKSEASEEDEEEEAADEEGGESEAKSRSEGEEPSEEEEPSPKKPKRSKSAATPASTSKRGQPSRSARKVQFPSDADIKATIKELLKGVNLEEVTMKEMTTKVYDKFPNVDLTSKKEFIKETVKALLSSSD